MKLLRLLFPVFALFVLVTFVESKDEKARKTNIIPIEFFSTKELDSAHLIRIILVMSGVPFSEVRFKKGSSSQTVFFDDIMKAGYLNPSLPMISDASKSIRHISTDEAIISYIIISYNRKLFLNNTQKFATSIQISVTVRNYIKKVTAVIETSKSLTCSALLNIENMDTTLKVLDDAYIKSENKYLYTDYPTYVDVAVYTLSLFVENILKGCVVTKFSGIRKAAVNLSSIPYMRKFENSSYFLSLLVPGTNTLAERIDFLHGTNEFASLTG